MLTVERLREVLHYNPQTGIFVWRVSLSTNVPAGMTAGTNCYGYVLIKIDWNKYRAHRLAWLYMTGEWPISDIDHRDMNRSNNRWENLRLATKSQNRANAGRRIDNTSGYKGIRWYHRTKRWVAQISFQGRKKTLGYFKTAEEARAVLYYEAARNLFW